MDAVRPWELSDFLERLGTVSLSAVIASMLALRAAGPALKRQIPLHCRRIFSFPSFQSGPETFHETRVLPCVKVLSNSDVCSLHRDRYSQKELYAVVADVASYPTFIPFCTSSRIDKQALERAMQGRTVVEAQLSVGFMNFTEKYTSIVTCEPFKSVQVGCVPKGTSSDAQVFLGRCGFVDSAFQDACYGMALPTSTKQPPVDPGFIQHRIRIRKHSPCCGVVCFLWQGLGHDDQGVRRAVSGGVRISDLTGFFNFCTDTYHNRLGFVRVWAPRRGEWRIPDGESELESYPGDL